jgi:hydroxyacylglutathione hydrolase
MGDELRAIDVGGVYCFLFETDRGFVLVDTGFAFQRGVLEAALEAAGCEPGRLALIVLTHGDGDHVGNCAYLKAKYGAKVAMHREDALSAGGDPGQGRKVRLGLLSILEIFTAFGLAFKAMKAGSMKMEPFEVDFFLEEGRSLEDYGVDATVVHLPGHSRGSIGLLMRDGRLIAGDLFMNLVAPNLSSIRLGGGETASSLGRLDGLGVREILPSHGRPFDWKRYANSLKRKAGPIA